MRKRVLFTDRDIIDFCQATQDTNEIHDPSFMNRLGKRTIVPGMLAFSCTVNLSEEFLKQSARRIQVYFNSLLSAGEYVELCVSTDPSRPEEVRLSAVNSRDMLSTQEAYTRMMGGNTEIIPQRVGIFRKLPITREQMTRFARLIGSKDKDAGRFLFAVCYASQALFKSIMEAQTDVEHEIDRLINGHDLVSPFYQTLEITLPVEFPVIEDKGTLDYLIHFEREKKNKAYQALLECQQNKRIIYQSLYKLVAIPDNVILRLAK